MSLADLSSGDPPAVTHEMLEEWRKLGDDVSAALTMGGEGGMDMLRGLMAEWCEAVEDVNTAREICVNMAASGRRHEAVYWHADGFFDVADRLSPERPGWEAWELTFAELGVIVPRVNHDLKEMADNIHEDLLTQDVSGTSLDEQVKALRRNVLARGHLGERLTILQEIRAIDPAGGIWEEMLRPIRARRASEIEGELAAAVVAEDFVAIGRIEREVATGDWGPEGPPVRVSGVLDAAVNWRQVISLRRPLAEYAADVSSRTESLKQVIKGGGANVVTFPAILEGAVQSRNAYQTCRQQLQDAWSSAQRVAAIAQQLATSGLAATVQQSDAAVRTAIKVIDEAAKYFEWVRRYRQWEADAQGIIHSAPLEGGDWEEAKKLCRAWLDNKASTSRAQLGKLEAKSPVGKPDSTVEVVRRLDEVSAAVRSRLDGIKRKEKLILVGVVSGIVLVVLVIGLAIAMSAGGRS